MFDDRNGRKSNNQNLSWREVDKLREKSQRRDRDPMQKQSSPAAMAAQKSYRAALERAFESGRINELAKTLSGGQEQSTPPTGAPTPKARKAQAPEPAAEAERKLLPAAPA